MQYSYFLAPMGASILFCFEKSPSTALRVTKQKRYCGQREYGWLKLPEPFASQTKFGTSLKSPAKVKK
jgi:hypothetical protein